METYIHMSHEFNVRHDDVINERICQRWFIHLRIFNISFEDQPQMVEYIQIKKIKQFINNVDSKF